MSLRLPLLLVALVAARHQLVDVAAMAYPNPDHARRVLFYIAGGACLACLYAVVWFLCRRHRTPAYPVIAMACLWGVLEEGQVAVCRAVGGISAGVSAPMWRGLCDGIAGVPLSTLTLALPVLILAWLVFSSPPGRKENG